MTGDTVSEPFKDFGPALNILIKLISVVALVVAPVLVSFHGGGDGAEETAEKAPVEKVAEVEAAPVNATK